MLEFYLGTYKHREILQSHSTSCLHQRMYRHSSLSVMCNIVYYRVLQLVSKYLSTESYNQTNTDKLFSFCISYTCNVLCTVTSIQCHRWSQEIELLFLRGSKSCATQTILTIPTLGSLQSLTQMSGSRGGQYLFVR